MRTVSFGSWYFLGCCCRIRCCGIATLFFQCLAIPLALCVIGFDGYFLNNPTQCFFSTSCSSLGYSYSWYGLSNTDTLYNIKVPLIRGQLATGVLMLVSCMIYIVIYALTAYTVSRSTQFQRGTIWANTCRATTDWIYCAATVCESLYQSSNKWTHMSHL